MEDLIGRLAAHRRRIKFARTTEEAVRWAFYASILGCACLAASKITGMTPPAPAAAALLAAIPLAMAAREWIRPFSVRDCAIHLDRALGLEERLSTAVEFAGAMGGAQGTDAARALSRAKIPPRRLPREAKLLGASALLLAVLLAAPAPERSGSAGNPALEAAAEAHAEKLSARAGDDPAIRRVAELLREGRLEEAMELLHAARLRIEREIIDGKGGQGRAETLLSAIREAAAGLTAQLAAAGRVVHAPPPAAADMKLGLRQAGPTGGHSPDRSAPSARAEAPLRLLPAARTRADWDPRYDAVIRRYFQGKAP